MGSYDTEPTERHEELMSEVTPEKEIEVVQGVIEGVTQKKPDTWQVEVRPDGSQYTKKLWTKDGELVTSLTAKLGQAGAFVCGASYWTNQSGAQVRSLWINAEGEEAASSVATPAAAPKAQSNDGMSKEEWRRKDSAADKRALTAIAVSALTHTMPADPSEADLGKFLQRVSTLVTAWHASIEAERDGEEVPF